VKDDRPGCTCYLRLQEHGITEMEGFHVPEVMRWDDAVLVIEMTLVTRPFVLDFARACLDFPPDFSLEVWGESHRRWSGKHGDDWPRGHACSRPWKGWACSTWMCIGARWRWGGSAACFRHCGITIREKFVTNFF